MSWSWWTIHYPPWDDMGTCWPARAHQCPPLQIHPVQFSGRSQLRGGTKELLGGTKELLGVTVAAFRSLAGINFHSRKNQQMSKGTPPNRVSQTWCKKWLKSRTKQAPQTDQGHNSFVESKTPNTDLQLKMTPEHGSNMYDKCDFSLFSSCVDVSKAVQCLKFLHRFERFCFTFSSSNGWLISLSFRRDCF